MSLSKYQVLMQEVALGLSGLERRLGKITQSASSVAALFEEPLGEELLVRMRQLRRHLQLATLLLLELVQEAGEQRLRCEADGGRRLGGSGGARHE